MIDLGLDPSNYSLAIELFIRLLGAIYLVVYLPFLPQMLGLFGKGGILPIEEHLNYIKDRFSKKRFYYVPTLFWINASDRALLALIWAGIALSIALMLGIYPPLVLLLLYIIHLSLTSAGQEFLSFGWETLLMEITLAAFLLTATSPLNALGWISLNFILFRFYIQAGFSKIFSRDPNWRNFKALGFHYHSQPLPNTLAWYFHKLPMWFHQMTTLFTFYAEILVPLAIFAPPGFRIFAFTQLTFLQIGIWLTGNLSYLNHLSIILGVILLPNFVLEPFLALPIAGAPSSLVWQIVITALGALFLALQVICLLSTFFYNQTFDKILRSTYPFHMASPHGLFAVMTIRRYEIIIEGSNDGIHWLEYGFYFKPGDLAKRPKRISPFQPRIDWQAWFLPFATYYNQGWFQRLLLKLLEGSPEVLKLFQHNPFLDKPPVYIRALAYDYEFTSLAEKRETGNWWKRTYAGVFAPAMKRNR